MTMASIADLGLVQTQLNRVEAELGNLARRFDQAGLSIPDLIETKTAELEVRMGQFRGDVQSYVTSASEQAQAVVAELAAHRTALAQQPHVIAELAQMKENLDKVTARTELGVESLHTEFSQLKARAEKEDQELANMKTDIEAVTGK